jgi:preprotein translocase subunit SecE
MSQIDKLSSYLKDSYHEMKRVTWPTKQEVRQHTLLVISISLGVALFLGIVDYILTIGLEQIIK